MDKPEVTIRIAQRGPGTCTLTATFALPHKGVRGIKMVPTKTITRTIRTPYADALTPGLLTEWVTALTLVAAGWYENRELPFG